MLSISSDLNKLEALTTFEKIGYPFSTDLKSNGFICQGIVGWTEKNSRDLRRVDSVTNNNRTLNRWVDRTTEEKWHYHVEGEPYGCFEKYEHTK